MMIFEDMTLKQLMILNKQIETEIFYRIWWVVPTIIIVLVLFSYIVCKKDK